MYITVYVGIVLIVGISFAFFTRRKHFVPDGFCGLLYFQGKSLHRISPGTHTFWKRGYSVRLVDMRRRVLHVHGHEVAAPGRAPTRISAVLTFQIIQAETAVHGVHDYAVHLHAAVGTALRTVLAVQPYDPDCKDCPEIGEQIRAHVSVVADRIGIVIHGVELTEKTRQTAVSQNVEHSKV